MLAVLFVRQAVGHGQYNVIALSDLLWVGPNCVEHFEMLLSRASVVANGENNPIGRQSEAFAPIGTQFVLAE